ncbi:MAG: NB-ARC domain-containing protein [Chitinophagaceae bacterium]
MAPRLSEVVNYVERPGKILTLKNLLLHGDEPVSITTALQGSGGFGKTTLANALCNDEDIILAIYRGILWVTLGQQKGSALTALQKLYDAIGIEKKTFLDVEQAQHELKDKLVGKNYLLVLDDAWHRVDVEDIIAATTGCAVLITTRMDRLMLHSRQEQVDEMTAEEAVRLLSRYAGIEYTTDSQLSSLAQKLGYWALLLKLVGAQLKARMDEGESIGQAILYVNKRLEKKGLTGFDMSDAERRNDSVTICLQASIELLESHEQEKLYGLGIFPEDENIPFQVLEKYWEMDDDDCEDFLDKKLHKLGLVDLDLPNKNTFHA